MTEGGANDGGRALMGQSVLSRIAARIRADDQERTERVSLLALCFLIGLPIIVHFDHQRSPGRGYVGALFVIVFMVLGWAQRGFRNRIWYWLVMVGLAVLHTAIWLCVPLHWDVSRGAISLIGYSDFFCSWVAFVLCERFFNRGDRRVEGGARPET